MAKKKESFARSIGSAYGSAANKLARTKTKDEERLAERARVNKAMTFQKRAPSKTSSKKTAAAVRDAARLREERAAALRKKYTPSGLQRLNKALNKNY